MAYNYPYFNANYTPPAAPQMTPPAPMFGGVPFGQPAAQSNVSWVYVAGMRRSSKRAQKQRGCWIALNEGRLCQVCCAGLAYLMFPSADVFAHTSYLLGELLLCKPFFEP